MKSHCATIKPSQVLQASSEVSTIAGAGSRGRSDRPFYRWNTARAVMQVRRPDGAILPSTASCRFTSDARSQTACTPWIGVAPPFPRSSPRAARRVRDCSCMCTDLAPTWPLRSLPEREASCTPVATAAASQPCGILTAPPRVSQFVGDPILCIPAQSTQASSKSRGATNIHLPSSLGSRRKFGMFQTRRHSFILQTGCFTQMGLE